MPPDGLDGLELVPHVEVPKDVVNGQHMRADAHTLEALAAKALEPRHIARALEHLVAIGGLAHHMQRLACANESVERAREASLRVSLGELDMR